MHCLFSLFLFSIPLCPIVLRTKAVFLCPPKAFDEHKNGRDTRPEIVLLFRVIQLFIVLLEFSN